MTAGSSPAGTPDPVEVIRGHLADIGAALDNISTAIPALSVADLPVIRQALAEACRALGEPARCPFCFIDRLCAVHRRRREHARQFAALLDRLGGPPGPELGRPA